MWSGAKRGILQLLFILAEQSACCTTLDICLASQASILLLSAAPARTVRAACIVHLLFATPLGLAASLRPDGFVSGAVRFVRRTFADWSPKVQKRVNLVDLAKSFQTSVGICYLLAKFGFDTAENGPLKVC